MSYCGGIVQVPPANPIHLSYHCILWPITLKIFPHHSNLIEISSFSHATYKNDFFITKFSTWGDSSAVMACAKKLQRCYSQGLKYSEKKFPVSLNRDGKIISEISSWCCIQHAWLIFISTLFAYVLGPLSLTHWSRVTHICFSKLTTIGSDNGLSPGQCQAIIWTNAGILLIQTLGTNFSEILRKMYTFSFKSIFGNVVWKMSAIVSRPQCVYME